MSGAEDVEVLDDEDDVTTSDDEDDGPPQIIEPVLVPTGLLVPNAWNPFEEPDETFNMLVEEIEKEGFDEPITVVPIEGEDAKGGEESNVVRDEATGWLVERGTRRYRIVNGEHRWKSARVLDMELVPCIIKAHWDERDQKIQTVRRNMMRGEVNARKFTDLLEDIAGRLGIGAEATARKMGVFDQKEFGKWYLAKKKARRKATDKKKEQKKSKEAVENLTSTLHEIFRKHGKTVPQGYVVFAYKGHTNLLVSMDGKLKRQVDAMDEFLRVTGQPATTFLLEAIEQKMLATSLGTEAAEEAMRTDSSPPAEEVDFDEGEEEVDTFDDS